MGWWFLKGTVFKILHVFQKFLTNSNLSMALFRGPNQAVSNIKKTYWKCIFLRIFLHLLRGGHLESLSMKEEMIMRVAFLRFFKVSMLLLLKFLFAQTWVRARAWVREVSPPPPPPPCCYTMRKSWTRPASSSSHPRSYPEPASAQPPTCGPSGSSSTFSSGTVLTSGLLRPYPEPASAQPPTCGP
jgi:hypothetical protein